MNYLRSVLILCMVFLLCSCISSYSVTKIPRSSDNLKAARECQHTVAAAIGYNQDGYNKLKMDCYKTLEDTDVVIFPDRPHSITGCQLFDEVSIGGASGLYYLYFLCKPAAVDQRNP